MKKLDAFQQSDFRRKGNDDSVVLLPQAIRDIDRNANWWADHHSLEEASNWLDKVYKQIATLADFPQSHGLSAENEFFPYEIRDQIVGLGSRPGYRAVFTVRGNNVYVLAVRRGSQDVIRPEEVGELPR